MSALCFVTTYSLDCKPGSISQCRYDYLCVCWSWHPYSAYSLITQNKEPFVPASFHGLVATYPLDSQVCVYISWGIVGVCSFFIHST